MGGDSSFQQKWVEQGDRPWLQAVKDSKLQAHCTLCDSKFSVKSGGISAVKAHENGKTHTERAKQLANNTVLTNSNNNEVKVSRKPAKKATLEDQVLSAEIIEAMNKVDKNQSFQSADDDNKKFSKMFPDSEIAQHYKQGQTKIKYNVQFWIAPYIKSLLMSDMAHEQFCFHFDETTTSQVKKQYDGYITYFSKKCHLVTCSYAGSLFVGHCPASALVEHFHHFIEDLNLDLENLMNLGMDGPNVNLKFSRDLQQELEENNKTSFMDTGGCTLHTVHNAFGKGMSSLKDTIDLDQLVIDLHFFFKKSSARREDYCGMSAVTDVAVHYLLRHCESRWLGIEKVLVRVIEQIKNIKEYFLNELPKKAEFKGKNGIGNSKRYQRISNCLNDPSLPPLMAFVVYVAQDFKSYIVPLETNAPMIHVLHKMGVKLVHGLMSKFIDPKLIQDNEQHKTFTAQQLLEVDVTDKRNHLAKIQVGAKAASLLKNVEPLVKKNIVVLMTEFYEACTSHLLNKMPLGNPIIKKAKVLHPDHRHNPSSLTDISFLAQAVCKSLGDKAMKEAFSINSDQTKYDLYDMIRTQFNVYQMETLPEFKVKGDVKKQTVIQKTSYWRKAYEIAGVGVDSNEVSSASTTRRIDDFWFELSERLDDNGKKKFPQLWTLVKCVMLVSHGNADPERGFSINKHMLQIHGNSLGEETIVAIRLVKDHIVHCGGLSNVLLTDSLLDSCRAARSRYQNDLEAKRKQAEKESAAKAAAAEAEAAAQVALAARKKKDEKLDSIEKEMKGVKAGIAVADETNQEANEELKVILNKSNTLSKTQFVAQVTKVQAKIDMATKRKQELTEEMDVILEKKRKIE